MTRPFLGLIENRAVSHFQQAVEKAVKAVLTGLGIFQKTHLVGAVLREVTLGEKRVPAQWKDPLLEAARLSEELEPEVSLTRCPGIIDDVRGSRAKSMGATMPKPLGRRRPSHWRLLGLPNPLRRRDSDHSLELERHSAEFLTVLLFDVTV